MEKFVKFSGPRQGDVLIEPIDAIPADAIEVEPTGNKVILAYGEVTGHHHRFEFMDKSHNAKLYSAGDGTRFLHVTGPLDLLHEEHETVPSNKIPVGFYILPTQVEYTPAAVRRVTD